MEWAVSSPHAQRQFVVAVRLAEPSCVRDVQQEAITKYASEHLPPDECSEIILNLNVPKSAWRTLSEVYIHSFVYHAQNGINVFCSSKMNP